MAKRGLLSNASNYQSPLSQEFITTAESQVITLTREALQRAYNREQLAHAGHFIYGKDFEIRDERTIIIHNRKLHLNMQLTAQLDFAYFEIDPKNGDCVGVVYDHKLGNKKPEDEAMQVNAFFYKVVLGLMIVNKKRHTNNGEIVINGADLDHPDLMRTVISQTKFFTSSLNGETVEILADLDEFQYFRLISLLKQTAEGTLVMGREEQLESREG